MSFVMNWKPDILDLSVQINNGLTQTSGDGTGMAFDSKYGIMFCFYMPGMQGCYGESRGRVCLTYFPASQPTNAMTIDIASGRDVYVPNIVGLGEGRVRVLYEDNSKADCDHFICYKDFINKVMKESEINEGHMAIKTISLGKSSFDFHIPELNNYKYIRTITLPEETTPNAIIVDTLPQPIEYVSYSDSSKKQYLLVGDINYSLYLIVKIKS